MIDYPLGWTCEITIVRLESYVLRTLPHVDALAIAAHLEACGSCSHRLALRMAPEPRG